MGKVTIKDLLEAGVHFGHQTKRWNPNMKEYVYGEKNGIYIIDLTKTMHQLANACNFLQHVVSEGGKVLFVGTKRQAQEVVKNAAEKTGMFHITERWLGGTLTNNATIQKSIAIMDEIDKKINSAEAQSIGKKELASLTRKSLRLHRNLYGIREMKKLPAAIVIVDICHDDIAVQEANKLKIPIVALVDTNGNPEKIDYPIPANDDAVRSIGIIINLFADAISDASVLYQKRAAEEKAIAAAKEAEEKEKISVEQKKEKIRKKTVKRAEDKRNRAMKWAPPKKVSVEKKSEKEAANLKDESGTKKVEEISAKESKTKTPQKKEKVKKTE